MIFIINRNFSQNRNFSTFTNNYCLQYMLRKNLKLLILLFGVSSALSSCSQTKTSENMHTNELINESSPYLLHHAHNPVNWYPWNDKALNKANEENKLLIISIGYAACHWCHVMEKESFSDSLVASTMNANYISIKIDREERPDLDQIYMDAATLTNGSGGWPLNVIALPDGRPVFAGTYFPKEKWIDILDQVNEIYLKNPQRLIEIAEKITDGIRHNELTTISADNSEYKLENLESGFNSWMRNIDFKWGGYKRAPKFPLPVGFKFLLEYHYLTNNEKALDAVKIALNRMAWGGLYDHAGGGFARYSVDEYWKVPHFEKMLYDNAQLISLYSYAFQLTKDPYYKKIVEQTIEFSKRELSDVSGLFYSSLDADSEGVEGKYYVWQYDELEKILGDKMETFAIYFDIQKGGNWEHGNNILFATESINEFAVKESLDVVELEKLIETSLGKLFGERQKRIRPGLDDKCITAWNGLMITAYVDAYRVIRNLDYLKRATKAMNFILENNADKDYKLTRIHKDGQHSINAFLDDYTSIIEALIALYQVTFEKKWLVHAQGFSEYVIEHFYSKDKQMFYYTSNIDPELIARKIEIPDNVIPSSNSIMANNLFKLGILLDKNNYSEISESMLLQVKDQVENGSPYYANWASLYLRQLDYSFEVVIMGEMALNYQMEFDKQFFPLALYAGSQKEENLPLLENRLIEGETKIYVCRNKTCKLPVTTIKDAIEQIKE